MTVYTMGHPSGEIFADGVSIGFNDSTPAYQSYVAFLRTGAGPTLIPDPVPLLPRIDVSAWQIRRALIKVGLFSSVEAAVASSDDIELQVGWLHSPRFYSDNELAITMGTGLGKSREEMYALFQLAASL